MSDVQPKLISIIPSQGAPFTPEGLDEFVRLVLDVPAPTARAEKVKKGLLDAARLAMGMASGAFTIADEARIARAVSSDGFRSLSEADRAYLYDRSRPVLLELARRLLDRDDVRAGGAEVTLIPQGDARLESVRSADGSFALRHVYVAHPYERAFYIPLARFHRYLLDEKWAEFVRLVASLGVRAGRLLDAQDAKTNAGANVGVAGVKGVDVGAGASTNVGRADEFSLSLSAEEPPSGPPHLPIRLLWYHHEPLWQAMAETRIGRGITSYNVSFRHTEDFGVTAGLCARIAGMGLEAGGSFQQSQSVSKTYEVTFWPRA